jgi:hypothetical protein
MSKHTSGPWNVGPIEGSQGVRIWQTDENKNEKKIVGFVLQSRPLLEIDAETEANARLIAAAPDLLDVLKWFMPFITSEEDDERQAPWVKRARAAIAKATGEVV